MTAAPSSQADGLPCPEAAPAVSGRASQLMAFLCSRRGAALLALCSLLWVAFYVFYLAPYQEYLFSDMKGYWQRAIARLNGDIFSDSQFIAWPPLYHIFLATVFGILRDMGLGSLVALETGLAINIAVFAVSVYAFHRLATHWFVRPSLALVAVLLYGFGFPAFYFNAFLLAGNLGAPLLVIAIALAVCKTSWHSVVLAALLFGVAAIVRPSLGPYGLAFVVLYLSRYGWLKKDFIARAALFSVAFFAVVGLGSAEVSRISGGRVNGLSANGGLDFFIASTEYHRVDLAYEHWDYFVVVPAMSWRAESGVFYTDVPFYEQSYYFDLGKEAISRRPWRRLLIGAQYVHNLFFADMLPSRTDAPGFTLLRPVWDGFKFIMLLGAGLLLSWRAGVGQQKPLLDFSLTTLLVTVIVAFLFTGEPRYTYEIIAVFYLLFFKLFDRLTLAPREKLRRLAGYAGVVLLVWASAAVIAELIRPDYPPSVSAQIEALDSSTPRQPSPLKDEAATASEAPHYFGRLRFPFLREGQALRDESDVDLVKDRPARVRFRTVLNITGSEDLRISFRAFSQWPYSFYVDGQTYIDSTGPNYFSDARVWVLLTPGEHLLEAVLDFEPTEGGFSMNYGYTDDDWLVMRALGVSTDLVQFRAPGAAQGLIRSQTDKSSQDNIYERIRQP